MVATLVFGAGVCVGMMLIALLKTRALRLSWGIVQPFLLPSVMLVVSGYLVKVNWLTFTRPPSMESWPALQAVLLKNPANETIILFGIFFGLLGVLSFVIRIPLANWQQIKLFGLFEATRLKEEAKDQFQAFRELEWHRITSLGAMASDFGLQAIQEQMNGLELDANSALNTFCEVVVSSFDENNLRASISAGHIERVSELPLNLPRLVVEAIRIPKVAPVTGNWSSAIALPIDFGRAQYIVWLHAVNYTFTETDAAFTEAMAKLLECNFERACIKQYMQEVGVIGES